MQDAIRSDQFIGRDDELMRLQVGLAEAGTGVGGVVIVGGEAGIGKTWLLERFAAGARERGTQVLIGGCLEFGGRGVPFAPFVEVIHRLVASTEPGRLPAVLGPGRRDLARLVPEVAGRPMEGTDGAELDRSAEARLFEAILGLVERIGRSAPAVLIIEDVQWADEDTRDCLTFLVRHLRSSTVFVVLSVRTDDLDPGHRNTRFLAELERDEGVSRIELRAFGRTGLKAILARHGGPSLPGDRLDEVLVRSDGNPFYALQLVDMIRRGQAEMPAQVRDVLQVRLGGLSAPARNVVRAAAAAGTTFDDDLLVAVVGEPAGSVADALREAIEAGVLVTDRGWPAQPAYAFRHSLLREVAYDQLLGGERTRLHAKFASALLDRRRRGQRVAAAAIAFHLEAAGNDREAVAALIEAGEEAEGAFAFAVARRDYERALELWSAADLDRDPGGRNRSDVLLRAAECALFAGAYERAIELGRLALTWVATIDPADQARLGIIHERLRWYLWEAGDDEAAEAAVAESLRLIPAEPPSSARARVLGQAAGLTMFGGNLPAAATMATDAVTVARAASAPAEEAFALGILGWCQAASGDVDRGLSTFREGLTIAERLGGAEGIALGHANYAALLDRVGETEASLDAALAGVAVVRRLGVSRTYGGTLLGHATKALFDLGRWPEALTRADEGLDLDPVGLSAIWLHINHARLDTNRGRFGDAADHLRQARAIRPSAGRSGGYDVAVLAAEAELARWQGRLGDVRVAVDAGVASIVTGRPLDPALGWLAATGLRAEADAAMAAQARHDVEAVGRCRERGAQIVALVRRLSGVPSTSADGRRDAILALCRAEAGRLMGRPDGHDPDDWQDVARRWEALRRPYPAAYARFRAGEAEIGRRGDRQLAKRQLKDALDATIVLGANPLSDAIELLARHARIELHDAVTTAAQTHDDGGLTPREVEVIKLVSAGWSNQQIADALFITRKTASVHVSNIMSKMGVRNRVEASAVAHRLGLAGEGGPPSGA